MAEDPIPEAVSEEIPADGTGSANSPLPRRSGESITPSGPLAFDRRSAPRVGPGRGPWAQVMPEAHAEAGRPAHLRAPAPSPMLPSQSPQPTAMLPSPSPSAKPPSPTPTPGGRAGDGVAADSAMPFAAMQSLAEHPRAAGPGPETLRRAGTTEGSDLVSPPAPTTAPAVPPAAALVASGMPAAPRPSTPQQRESEVPVVPESFPVVGPIASAFAARSSRAGSSRGSGTAAAGEGTGRGGRSGLAGDDAPRAGCRLRPRLRPCLGGRPVGR